LIHEITNAGRWQNRPALVFVFVSFHKAISRDFLMPRTAICLAALLLVAGALDTASAQTTAPAPAATTAAPAAKPSRIKLTTERLKEMKAKWLQNRGKLKACRGEVKRQGLAGDDRWFYIADCMEKT
jgi:hypothetical protein